MTVSNSNKVLSAGTGAALLPDTSNVLFEVVGWIAIAAALAVLTSMVATRVLKLQK